ncbi:CoA transferase [Arthrobacter sp. GMC3]|uniref:CoA transferase n=1 Tax=Arthrobacter sp. GMC3 TaxID=2058894 RepID=UPI000CE416E0|nr:CoA transferase [Arthrobacter sp. GMC3]
MANVLDGVRVVSLAINLPGPLAAASLAELGATVIKVEPPSGDPLAAAAPAWYNKLTAGQKVVALDLKAPHDRAELDLLLQNADILLTANRPSALRRLGLLDAGNGPNPRMSHVEIVGHDGDREETPGHDLNYQAAHGTLQAPNMPLAPIADLMGAERAVQSALAAILIANKTGRGSHHRVVLEDAAYDAGAAVRNGLTGAGTPLGGAMATYGIYATAEGHVALGAIEPVFQKRTLALLNVDDDKDALAAAFATKTAKEWESLGVAHDIPLTAVRTSTPKTR